MDLGKKIEDGIKYVNKHIWIISIPIIIDLITLFLYQVIYQISYTPAYKFFALKLGFVSSPPSVSYLLEDFPTILFQNNQNGIVGFVNRITASNVLLIITVTFVMSFISSVYLCAIDKSYDNAEGIKNFLVNGNKLWPKFFIIQAIGTIPFILIIFSKWLIISAFINILFIYVSYSFIVDEVNIKENFRRGIGFLFGNFGLTIKIALYFGFILSFISIFIFLIAKVGTAGVIVDIIVMAYLGTVANKAVLEIYREKVSENIEVENMVYIQE
ncbi:MAG: hypothetical protein Q8936_00485 [Bacillota bacterium]|nr:hypothetical protein [Bacillota bacterium]